MRQTTSVDLPDPLTQYLSDFAKTQKPITIMTGAGISAESNIPTFRGPEGFWTVGSAEYHPQEMATFKMFKIDPDAVWTWYLYRMGICKKAVPNSGHKAIARMEQLFKDRFTLITQNVDNLHLEAGNSLSRTFQIHGNIFYMRCADECSPALFPLPEQVTAKSKGESLTDMERNLLRCPNCGQRSRPHVLWFDETYDEHHFRFSSSLNVARKTELLIIVGTSGSTNLPNQVAWQVRDHNGMIIDINIDHNLFSQIAVTGKRGHFIKHTSSIALKAILEILENSLAGQRP